MGGLFAYLAAEAMTAVKRKATVYGLMVIGGVLLIFSAGYVLNAGYLMLAFRLGGTFASLIIAGGLVLLAVASVIAGTVIGKRPLRPASHEDQASPYSHAPYRGPYSPKRLVAVAAGAAGALSTAIAILKSKRLRNLLRR